jgi:5-methylthioadenosine/S-adenosylhomocysteine deaminase
MTKTLIKNGYVVTVDGERRIFDKGAVAVSGKHITGVYSSADTPPRSEYDEVIDASGCLVVPGLINLHQHHWYSMFKGIADGMLLEDWISDLVFPLVSNLSDEAISAASKCSLPVRPVPSTIRCPSPTPTR